MKLWLPFAGIAVLAGLAGTSLYLAGKGQQPLEQPSTASVEVTPAALLAARFTDTEGREQSLAQLAGRVIVLNFWATWCTPCREEMPGFVKLQARWADRGVRFVGIANDDPAKVVAFGRELRINYPLWVGGTDVMDLSRRLGNRLGVLPHTVIVDPEGRVLESRIGVFEESSLEKRLIEISPKSS